MRFNQHSGLLVVGILVYLFMMHLASINGQLLSDSVSLIYTCHSWQQTDQMMHQLLSLFSRSSNEAGGSFMFRPLAILSLCTDYMLWGENAYAHKLIQLLWHLGNGVLLYVLLAKVCRHYQLNVHFAALTACLFLLSHLTPEISVWLAGRFDVLVQTCMLLSLYAFWAHRRLLGLFWFLLALLSKESAMLIAPMIISLSFFRHWGTPGWLKKITLETWLYIVLLLLYFIYRWFIFGQSTQVYPQGGDIFDRLIGHAATFPLFLWHTLFAAVNQTSLSVIYLIVMLVLCVYSFVQARRHNVLRLWLFLVSGMVIVLLALLTQMGAGEKAGTGARLFYIMIPWQAALLSLPVLFKKTLSYRIGMLVLLLLTGLMHCLVIKQWTTASQIAKSITHGIPEMAESVDKDNWALLLIPEQIGPALLGRNAQGGLAVEPIQKQHYLDSVVPFIWRDLEQWRERANSAFVTAFKSNSDEPNEYPKYAFCMLKQGGYKQQTLRRDIFISAEVWRRFWEDFVNDSQCHQ